jgi:hypothetical protein
LVVDTAEMVRNYQHQVDLAAAVVESMVLLRVRQEHQDKVTLVVLVLSIQVQVAAVRVQLVLIQQQVERVVTVEQVHLPILLGDWQPIQAKM